MMTKAKWRKASFSDANGACVELADTGDAVAIRDSKDPDGPVLRFTKTEIDAFLKGVKSDEFDDFAM